MTILVIAEHDNAELKAATLNTVAAAAKIGGDIHVLVAGSGAQAVADQAAKVAGVSAVLLADAPQLADALAENVAEQVIAVAGNYSHILFPATASGKNVAPRVAAKLDVAQISDIIAVESADVFQRPIYAGNAIATVECADAKKSLPYVLPLLMLLLLKVVLLRYKALTQLPTQACLHLLAVMLPRAIVLN